MGRLSYLSFMVLLFAACYHNTPQPVFDMTKVLPQDTMVVLLTDLQLVDGAVSLKARSGKPSGEFSKALTDLILKKHNIDQDVFNESIRYYSFHIEKMNAIYEKVINNLALMESKVNKPPKE